MLSWLCLFLIFAFATPAEAGPVAAAIGALWTTVTATTVGAFVARTLVSLALSRLSMLLKGKPKSPGITTETTTTGGTNPQTFIVGRYATAGQFVGPPNSFGAVGKTPRAYLVYPVALSVIGGCTLERLILNDAYIELGASDAMWGRAAVDSLAGWVYVDYLDGSQTTAHAGLLSGFGADPDRPWFPDMVGPGVCYAVIKARYNRTLFNNLPTVRFEMMGVPLYDPRADSSVGGTGSHRWEDRATWTQTANPMVIIYNILRGITVRPEISVEGITYPARIWGGVSEAEDLPLAEWFAAMNACDVPVVTLGGGTEPSYRAGMEIRLSAEPMAVIEDLLKTCVGQLVEVGGVWLPRVGGPALPSYFISDDDILVSMDQEFDPFPSLIDTFNGITATYPEPENLWEPKDAPARFSDEWEAEDGGRQLVVDLDVSACPWGSQVQRLMASYIADHRRFRRHRFVLPPEAAVLQPLETIAWTSARFGYTDKVFEIVSQADSLMTMHQAMSVRERDGGDFSWTAGQYIEVDYPPSATTAPSVQTLSDFLFEASATTDSTGTARRPRLHFVWDGEDQDGFSGIEWEVRVAATGALLARGSISDVASGELWITEGVLPDTEYEGRARPVANWPVDWTGWVSATTDALLIAEADIGAGAVTRRGLEHNSTGYTINSGAATVIVTNVSVDAAAYFPASGLPDNPLLAVVSGTLALLQTTETALYISIEQSVDGGTTWAYAFGDVAYFAGGSVGSYRSYSVRIVDRSGGADTGVPSLFRAKVNLNPSAASPVAPTTSIGVLNTTLTLEQVNK